jgi:hypothetical protein
VGRVVLAQHHPFLELALTTLVAVAGAVREQPLHLLAVLVVAARVLLAVQVQQAVRQALQILAAAVVEQQLHLRVHLVLVGLVW